MKHAKYGILNWFVRQALEGKPLTIYGDGAQKRDYIHVEDLARAMLMGATQRSIKFDVFNLGSGTGLAFRDMTQLIATSVPGTRVDFLPWPKDRYFVETGDYISDICKIQSALGWKPRITIEEGVADTIAYYRKHAAHYYFEPREVSA